MPVTQHFGTIFDTTTRYQEREIPTKDLGTTIPGAQNLLMLLEQGWSFLPGRSPSPRNIQVVEGRGVFQRGSETLQYSPGTIFRIPANIPYAFVNVAETTMLVKHVRTTREYPQGPNG
jgi:hypothetical protein